MREIMLNLSEKIFKSLDSRGVSEAEFYGVWGKTISITVSNDKFKTINVKDVGEYGLRIAIDKKVAGIGSSDLTIDPEIIADRIVKIAKSSPSDPDWPGFAHNYSRGVMASIYDHKLAKMQIDELSEILRQVMEYSKEGGKKEGAEETIITRGDITVFIGGLYVANSYGENLYDELTAVHIDYMVKSRKEGEESSYYLVYAYRNLDEEILRKDAYKAGEYSVKFIKAKPIESGEYTLILDPYMNAEFLTSTLIPAFSALNIQQKRSPLVNKIGEKILSEDITIRDDPGIDWALGSRSFDDEGIPTRNKVLVDKGVLTEILYDYYTASKDNRPSTGNGFRRSPSSPPQPSPTNFVLLSNGNTMSIEDMIKETKKGILVHGLIGHWMSNYVNGATQGTVTHGFYIENGEIKHPVKGVVIGGNIYDWLGKDLVATGKEPIQFANIYTPEIMISKTRIAGK
ncbi:MAG: TldD/PmbA family protein [Staphylothermus sp.]|nr:TldD/PmbA family protein [Staphylothermus sp.]